MTRSPSRVLLLGSLAAGVAVSAVLVAASASPSAEPSRDELVQVDSMPSNLIADGPDAVWAEIDRRVAAWDARVDPSRFSDTQLVRYIDTIEQALKAGMGQGEAWWMPLQELVGRQGALCEELPVDHSYREYCG